ncbi:MAG: EamA family transporter, partial [Alcaligenaceae bacterium]|nr:EamA family transporter [Alcaligenaceae bacterium]
HTVLPTFMVMWAVARVGAPLASQLGMVGPVSVLFLAWWILDEPITVLQLLGTAFVLTGMLVLGRLRPRK